jgi:hypothetical protein
MPIRGDARLAVENLGYISSYPLRDALHLPPALYRV